MPEVCGFRGVLASLQNFYYSACQSNTTKLFGLMFVVLVLVRPQAGGVCARNRLHKIIPDGLILNRVIDYTPRMVTQKNVFRINCVMIPDSMVFCAKLSAVHPGKPNQRRPVQELFPGALWNQSSM